MKQLFEWDPNKAKINLKKHNVDFEDAIRVFADRLALEEEGQVENGEYRWRTLGLVDGRQLLLVVHTTREDEEGNTIIRIISARPAEPKERKYYAKNGAV